jgi:hypothetical protein
MFLINEILVSDSILEESFVCNLNACKGACCWEGDGGAPLETAELAVLEAIFEKTKPFLTPEGIEAVEKLGKFTKDEDGSFSTPLINGGACAYIHFDEKGMASCGIENAWRAGEHDFRKPISCHLYPIRVAKNETLGFEALNYHEWDICEAACALGKSLKIPVYKFLKEPIIRKYGEDFFDQLEAVAAGNISE